MSKNRQVSYGRIYHIKRQGKKGILKDSSDKIKLLSCLGAAREKYDFFLLGYCILDDQYHLVIKTHNISISKIMQSINTSFGKYYNSKYHKSPFKGRFKSKSIKETDLPVIINQVHHQPTKYKLVENIEEYPYTSHAFYQMNVDSIVDINYLLNLLSQDRDKAIKNYSNIMAGYMEYKPLKNPTNRIGELEKLLEEICPNPIDLQLIKEGSKLSYLMDYKKSFIKEAKNLGYSTKEIGTSINISDRAVRKHLVEDD